MNRIPIKIHRAEWSRDVPLPAYASDGSSGMDLRAAVDQPLVLAPGDIKRVPTGLAVSVPYGYEAQIRPRSGLALRHGIGMVNAPGTIDADYRGEVGVILVNWGSEPYTVRRGDRVAQMVIARVYQAELEEVEHLDVTIRGSGGFGHTGIR